ncbi:hypothetical protein PGRAN_14847 [Listeria grandensis FSL F6-0971]|uniref:Uncharacterized protein n=1 Tax=Listeria grandensis FSL F6-0971 TaxID=1265819 RepID=W7BAS4_9LIST|nr:hypothetical protein [Listeria grandensis]EUJ20056.1 hypothetical protein PGRAN_14847 [Listeria grandensis FSL F6-0971]
MEHFEKDVMEFIAARIENFYTNNPETASLETESQEYFDSLRDLLSHNTEAVKLLCSYSDALLNREILLTNKIYSLGYTDALSIISKSSLLP